MVSCLSLIASHLTLFFHLKALCFGIGGGVLLNFLDTQMKFEVTGVEIDPMVLPSHIFHPISLRYGITKIKFLLTSAQ